MEAQKIFLGVCYHKLAPKLKSKYLNPIHVGRALAKTPLPDMIGDDIGENISAKNPQYNELTALYWIWKNVDADYLGLMHYRRLLNFSASRHPQNGSFGILTAREQKKFGLNDQAIENACATADILTSPLFDTHPVRAPHMIMSNREMYRREHHGQDLQLIEEIVAKHSPHMAPYLAQVLDGRQAIFGNITVMRRALFDEYCTWLFDILALAEAQIDTTDYDRYQKRVLGFLAERLTQVFITYAKDKPRVTVRHLPLVSGTTAPPRITADKVCDSIRQNFQPGKVEGLDHNEDVHVAMAFDDGFVPHGAVAMYSALNTLRANARLHFHVLVNSQFCSANRDKLNAMVDKLGGHLSFYTVRDSAVSWLPMNRNHISVATYYRLLIPDTLPETIRKVIYLDADTIICDDLVKLWRFDLQGAPIGGAPDEGGVQQSRKLQLPLDHPYFNAGVTVFDLIQLRSMDLKRAVSEAFHQNESYVTLQDQDLLNLIFQKTSAGLPLRWNANTRLYLPNALDAAYSPDEAKKAAQNPGILHFTDSRKPWHLNCNHPLKDLYWEVRNQTPWSETTAERSLRLTKGFIRSHLNAQQRRDRREKNLDN